MEFWWPLGDCDKGSQKVKIIRVISIARLEQQDQVLETGWLMG